MTARTFTLAHLTDVEPIAVGDLTWLPLRRVLGATGFGIGAWTVAKAGDELIESHDETSTGAGAQQELYLVLGGRATFTVGDEELDAPQGTMVLVEVGTRRSAVPADPDTTVLVAAGVRAPPSPRRPSSTITPPSPPTTPATTTALRRSPARASRTGPTTRSSTTSSPASTPGPGAWTTRAGHLTSPSRATSARGSGRRRTTTWRRCGSRRWRKLHHRGEGVSAVAEARTPRPRRTLSLPRCCSSRRCATRPTARARPGSSPPTCDAPPPSPALARGPG